LFAVAAAEGAPLFARGSTAHATLGPAGLALVHD
jgi:hypothetical protein